MMPQGISSEVNAFWVIRFRRSVPLIVA
ncbi:hypothetical protein CHELA41_22584 [Hyphomicrobiales bacterium]|nr:hypothetical protein CHELA41_22584 [Hyphomicrobiales bacterium]